MFFQWPSRIRLWFWNLCGGHKQLLWMFHGTQLKICTIIFDVWIVIPGSLFTSVGTWADSLLTSVALVPVVAHADGSPAAHAAVAVHATLSGGCHKAAATVASPCISGSHINGNNCSHKQDHWEGPHAAKFRSLLSTQTLFRIGVY